MIQNAIFTTIFLNAKVKTRQKKYLDSIQGELNQRGAEANYEHNNQYKGPIKTIVNTTQSIGAGMQNAVEGIKSIPDFAMGTRKKKKRNAYRIRVIPDQNA